MSWPAGTKRTQLFWMCHTSGWAVLAGVRLILYYREGWGKTSPLFSFLFPYLSGYLTCIILRHVFKRFKRKAPSWKAALVLSTVFSYIGANIWMGADLLVSAALRTNEGLFANFTSLYLGQMLDRGMPLLGWSFLYFGISGYLEWKNQLAQWETASSLAQNAQLQMLRYQLNPHFLFNSMNSIRALIDEDEAKAKEMITELSQFLRYSLSSTEYSNVPLKDEIDALVHYFAIQQKRYEDKLKVEMDIAPDACDFPVLSFLIHPLVENAIKYGMQTSTLPLRIGLKAEVEEDTLKFEVYNTGRWVQPEKESTLAERGTGTGLDNVRQRLDNAFPLAHRFNIVEKEGIVRVKLEIDRPGSL